MPDNIRFENYELARRGDGAVHELGRGAMGVTYKAFDTDLHCHVALKVINPGILGNGDARERFMREARAAARLRHPNIATVFRLGRTSDDTHYYAMEFCEGPTLQEAVAQRGPFPAVEAVRIAWQVAKALILAEEHQLLHRDLKPSNLILTERTDEGTVVKVIDFGLAKSLADGQETLATRGSGGFVGTAHFASPEQLEEHDLDIRSDIYSLGGCLWFMLTGKPPFEGSLARVMSQTLTSEPPWERLAGQPGPLVALLRKMLAKKPRDRPPTAAALREELEACLQSLSSPVPSTDLPRAAKPEVEALDEHVFNTRFQMGERIGRDALGRIFRSTDIARSGTPVAVRVLDPGFVSIPSLRREIETRVIEAISHPHPNLLVPLAYGGGARSFLIAMPLTNGFTLLDLLKQRGALSPAEALRVLEPLALAVDHAARHKLTGLDLSKEQTVVHFPGGLADEKIAQVLASPLDQWPAYEIKAGVLSLGKLDVESDASLASMATMAPASGPAAVAAPVEALANLACEMLGTTGGSAFAPIARLSENANAVLRRALGDDEAFANGAAFYDALRTALGKAGSSIPSMRPSVATTTSISPSSSSRFKSLAVGALVLIVIVGLFSGYWFGIHQPRERDRKKREAEADTVAKDLAEKQHLAVGEQERVKAEAEKAKAEAEHAKAELEKTKLAAAISTTTQPTTKPIQTTAQGNSATSSLSSSKIVSDDQTHTSPDGMYSIRIIDEPMPGAGVVENFTIALLKQGNAIEKQPTTGFLMRAYWSPDGKYVAINNRRGNAGDYVWIFALPSGEVLKRPDDKIGEQWSKEAYRAMEEKNPSLKGAEVHHDWLTVTGWQNERLQLQLNTNFFRFDPVHFEGIAQPPEWTATATNVSEVQSSASATSATTIPQPTPQIGQFGSTAPLQQPTLPLTQTPEIRPPEKSWDKPHIYLQLADESQRGAATALKQQLVKSGYVVVAVENESGNEDIPATSTELRYFTPTDSVEAQRLATELAAFFGNSGIYADLPEGMPNVSHARQYEIWFSHSFSASSIPKERNALGMIEGTYYGKPTSSSGDLGRGRCTPRMVIRGSYFERLTTIKNEFNAKGRAAGRFNYSYTLREAGSITQNANGTLVFRLNQISAIERSSSKLTDSYLGLNDLKKGALWVLAYSDGRLEEPSTGDVFVMK